MKLEISPDECAAEKVESFVCFPRVFNPFKFIIPISYHCYSLEKSHLLVDNDPSLVGSRVP